MQNLIRIQKELKAPKDKMNSFGGYKYRSCESILEAVKPLLNGCLLLMSDEVRNIGTKNYVVATATFIEEDGKQFVVTAYAREPEARKGMDDSQITGASSSYARKYALGGLFAIDDGNDPDSQDNTKEPAKKTPEEPKKEDTRPWITQKQVDQAVLRIQAGEDILNKLKEEFRMSNIFKYALEGAKKK
jgi:hypothetical protein